MNEMKKDRDDPPVALVPVPGIKIDKGGSFDDGDPGTTNLYVGNIAPTVTGRVMICAGLSTSHYLYLHFYISAPQ